MIGDGAPSDTPAMLLRDRLERVGAWLERHGADTLVLRTAANLAWVTGGGDLRVARDGDPVAAAIVDGRGLTLVTDRIEAARLAEEVAPPGTTLEVVPWHDHGARDAAIRRLTEGLRVVDDADDDMAELRLPLTRIERDRFRSLGEDAARRLTDAAGRLEPDWSEQRVAAHLHSALRAGGMELPVVLVAGEERFARFRHPLPTPAPLGRFGLLVVCAERFGLVASFSRTVAFGEAPDILEARLASVQRVESAMLDATRSGVATEEVLRAARDAYEAEGVGDAWLDHHQGGPAGYAPREWLATPGERRRILAGTPVAWNPSLPLAKTEDTFLLHDRGLDNVTWDDRWPSVEVAGRPRAAVRVL